MAGRVAACLSAGVLLALLCGGCDSDAGKPKLGKVHGKVTYNGAPVKSGEVIFTPATGKGGTSGQVATGKIESDGSYELTTFNTGDGAILGQHMVTVQVHEQDGVKLGTPKPDGTFDYVLPKTLVPSKYASVDTSPLRCTVEEKDNTFNIDLKN